MGGIAADVTAQSHTFAASDFRRLQSGVVLQMLQLRAQCKGGAWIGKPGEPANAVCTQGLGKGGRVVQGRHG